MGEYNFNPAFTEAQEKAIEEIVRRVIRQELTVSISTSSKLIDDCYEDLVSGVTLALNSEEFSYDINC